MFGVSPDTMRYIVTFVQNFYFRSTSIYTPQLKFYFFAKKFKHGRIEAFGTFCEKQFFLNFFTEFKVFRFF